MSEPAFGLYSAASCAPGTRLAAGASLNLYTPLQAEGVTMFRRSLWLPISTAARKAKALELTGSNLALRFAPADIEVETGDTAWFSRVETPNNRTVHLEFVWPAPVRRFQPPAGSTGIAMHLHRVDGEQVADEASQNGSTGGTLAPPWVGSPVEVRLDADIVAKLKKGLKHNAQVGAKVRPRAAGGPSPVGQVEHGHIHAELLGRLGQSHVIPAIVVAGVPTSPRAKLVLERPTEEERLLWQGLLPGEQTAAVTLPAKTVVDEWAAALEQVVKAFAEDEKKRAEAAQAGVPITAEPEDALLRLDLESDTPCALILQQATLALTARFELAPDPSRVDFDGSQTRSTAIALGPLPAGAAQALTLTGRVDGGDGPTPAAGAGDAAQRRGILLGSEQTLVLGKPLPAPLPLAGLGLLWHPLSDSLKGRLAVLSDSGTGPGRPVMEQSFEVATTAPGWLALRWPAVDLQPQILWLRLAVEEGMGLWLAPSDAAPPAGWLESGATGKVPLAMAPATQWLAEGDPAQAGGLSFHLGAASLQAERDGPQLKLTLSATDLSALAANPLEASCGAPARLSIEAAELSVLL
jgi:hypothetical protein